MKSIKTLVHVSSSPTCHVVKLLNVSMNGELEILHRHNTHKHTYYNITYKPQNKVNKVQSKKLQKIANQF